MAANNPHVGYVLFEALYDYKPQDGEIELRVGDQCLVKKPLPHTGVQGWLDGVNIRTKDSGQFPGTYCKVLDKDAKPLVRRKTKPVPDKKPKKIIVGDHHLEKVIVKKPVWCSICEDYIWGGSTVSIMCSICLLCAHSGCKQSFKIIKCGEEEPTCKRTKEDMMKPVSTWTNEEVLEWMVAARLHPYLQLVKDNEISGVDLPNITEEYLKSLGIEFTLHAKIFKMCIDELLAPAPRVIPLLSLPFQQNRAINSHLKLYEHTFTTYQTCDICNKVMFGVFNQGFMCAICGIQCHRPCAYASIQECSGTYRRGRRPSDSEEPSFCCMYESVNIPLVMRLCIELVEQLGLKTLDLYGTNATYDQCQALRSALNQDPSNVDMNDDYWVDPRCAAYVLKTFLLELPIPLVASDCYDTFINLAVRDDTTSADISLALKELPECNFSHLDFLLRHLTKILQHCEENEATIEGLSRIFAILLVRPHECESWKLVSNLELHEKIVYKLLEDALERSNLPPPQNMADEMEILNDEIWFWSNATRKDVARRLNGTPDGSFIVRPSEARKGEWTLTVRKEGRDRLIKIIQRNGRYGFREDLLKFSSLKDLVRHFTIHTLEDYNEKLDVKLLNPCSRKQRQQVNEEDDSILTAKYNLIDEQLKEIKLLEFQAEDQQQSLEECKLMCESQTDIINFVKEQINLAQDQYKEAPNQDRPDIQTSLTSLNDLLYQEEQTWTELDDKLMKLKHECDMVNTKLTELSTELPNLQEEYSRIYQKMRDAKLDDALKDKENEDLKEIYDYLPSSIHYESRRNTDDELDPSYWLFSYKIPKPEIAIMLENKPDGTFLVRESDNYPYVISLVHDKSIKHIPIHRGPDGYGFANPHNVYPTISELINHYHSQSLRMHNKSLDTTLQTPYRFLEHTNDGPIYD